MFRLCCFQWVKGTNLKANHNLIASTPLSEKVVSNESKVLIWKQITTSLPAGECLYRCFQWVKGTNLKANHNQRNGDSFQGCVVSNESKVLIWKQITTCANTHYAPTCCFQWVKGTNLKANHNCCFIGSERKPVVSNESKVLIWKQITTQWHVVCFRGQLFPMSQRY